MKHASTRTLFDYWNWRRGRRRAPVRSEIDPADIRHILGDTFMLTADFVDDIRFRLAGTRVCALFAREIKGNAFKDLWSESSHEQIAHLLTAVIDEGVGAVAGVIGRTEDGAEVELEMLLLPLAHSPSRVRALGILTPPLPPYWLGERPVIELDLRTLRHIGAEQAEMGNQCFAQERDGRRTRHGFLVYSGGRESPSSEQTG
ncbi:MAG TPA: PAS domain-containing protein [Pseudolabrys sp.]|nr:PAS domain-containing protein [Pseudolabrys sp.]